MALILRSWPSVVVGGEVLQAGFFEFADAAKAAGGGSASLLANLVNEALGFFGGVGVDHGVEVEGPIRVRRALVAMADLGQSG